MKDIIVFNVARESPKNLIVTSLQLIVFFSNSLKSSFVEILLSASPKRQTKDSEKKTLFYPKVVK